MKQHRRAIFCAAALLCMAGCGGAERMGDNTGGMPEGEILAEATSGAYFTDAALGTGLSGTASDTGLTDGASGTGLTDGASGAELTDGASGTGLTDGASGAELTDAAPPPGAVALTFDDGPHPGTTDRLLDGLRDRDARATFFLVGEEAASNRDLVRRMAAEGHQVGNHTWSHRRLEAMERDEIAQEIGKTEALLESILGGSGYWVRPPYGLLRPGTEDLAGVPLVKWSVDPRDWESRNRDKIVSTVLDAAEPGSIILLHDIYPASVDAALDTVDRLQAQGYALVTVEELLRLYGREAVPGAFIRSAAD